MNIMNLNKPSVTGSTQASPEQISRWVDGDIAPHEIDLAMKTLAQEDGRYCWAEMHLVGDCIRGLEDTPGGCAERIRAAIALEPTVVAPVAKRARQLRERTVFSAMSSIGRGGRAWATAAAVAAVGFVGTVVYKDQTGSPQVATINTTATAQSLQAQPVSARQADFSAYLQAHQESADASSMSAVRQYLRPAVVQTQLAQ